MTDKFKYRFPASKQAEQATMEQQILKATEEMGEAVQALNKHASLEELAEELHDAAYAIEGCLRKLDQDMVKERFDYVRTKVKEREA